MGLYEYLCTMHDVCLDVAKTLIESDSELANFYAKASQGFGLKAMELSTEETTSPIQRWQLKRLEELKNFKVA